MKTLPIFKQHLVNKLWENIESNIDLYEKGDLTTFLSKTEFLDYKLFVDAVTFEDDAFDNLKTEAKGTSDVHNAEIVYKALKGMTPYLAADERIWVALTHEIAPKFSFKRHLKTNTSPADKIKLVKSSFFTRENNTRSLYRDNALSSLWWYGYICKKNKNHPLSDVLKAVLTSTDFRVALIERPTTSRVATVFKAITNIVIAENKNNKSPELMKRDNYREWFKQINLNGGRKLYAAMGADELEYLFKHLGDDSIKANQSK